MPEAHVPSHVLSNIESMNPWDLFTIPMGQNQNQDEDLFLIDDLELEEFAFD